MGADSVSLSTLAPSPALAPDVSPGFSPSPLMGEGWGEGAQFHSVAYTRAAFCVSKFDHHEPISEPHSSRSPLPALSRKGRGEQRKPGETSALAFPLKGLKGQGNYLRLKFRARSCFENTLVPSMSRSVTVKSPLRWSIQTSPKNCKPALGGRFN
jgi:hypothetical protein